MTKYHVRTFLGGYADKIVEADSEEEAVTIAEQITWENDQVLNSLTNEGLDTEVIVADPTDELTPIYGLDKIWVNEARRRHREDIHD